jgi:aminopeptidase N
MQDDLYEPWLTVFFPRIVKSDERFILEIAYKGKLVRRLRGGRGYVLKDTINWIPRHPDTRKKKFRLTFRIPENLDIASGGRRVEDDIINGTRVTRWIVTTPVRSTMAFQLGRFNIEQLTEDNLPPLSIYSDRNHPGFSPGSRERTSQDLIGSLRTYIDYFGPYPFESLVVTETPETDGQAFPGLVLLTFGAFGPLHSGEADLFWSHEVAHQWWGASVDWEDYRDQWISEGFAHYAAALYALIGLEDENQFNEMLDAWRHDVLGEVNVGQGIGLKRYGFRPTVIRESDGNKSGPIVAGYRLRTSDTPFDYRIQIYEKGAFILHMLRMLSLDLETGSDERFRLLMRTFAENHRGAVANTRAFEEAVTIAFDEPMDWFFDQWVYGTDVPTYRPDLKTSPVRDSVMPFVLHGSIRQENVPSEFKMAVPIRVEFEHHEPLLQRVWIDQPEISVEIPLPAEPTKILFNYQFGVLASVQ